MVFVRAQNICQQSCWKDNKTQGIFPSPCSLKSLLHFLMLLLQWVYLKHEGCAHFYTSQMKEDYEIPCYPRTTCMRMTVNKVMMLHNRFESACQTMLWVPLPRALRFCQPCTVLQLQPKPECSAIPFVM